MRKLGYTWDELLQEKCTRTFYSLRQLEEEAEEREENSPDNVKSGGTIG